MGKTFNKVDAEDDESQIPADSLPSTTSPPPSVARSKRRFDENHKEEVHGEHLTQDCHIEKKPKRENQEEKDAIFFRRGGVPPSLGGAQRTTVENEELKKLVALYREREGHFV